MISIHSRQTTITPHFGEGMKSTNHAPNKVFDSIASETQTKLTQHLEAILDKHWTPRERNMRNIQRLTFQFYRNAQTNRMSLVIKDGEQELARGEVITEAKATNATLYPILEKVRRGQQVPT